MRDMLKRLAREEDGQDLIEYGLLVGIITATVVGTIVVIGPKVLQYFTDLNDALP